MRSTFTTTLLFLSILWANLLYAQSNATIDSLQKVLEANISEKEKVDTYNAIAKA